MNFQISRNGQIYGPYTLDDLKRYLASGNVLLSDLAKSEDMPDWLPVSKILTRTPSTPAAAAPVPPEPFPAAFTSPVFDPSAPSAPSPAQFNPTFSASTYADPPGLHWALVALFSLFTCGLFMLVWNLLVTAWLKRVQPSATAFFFYIGEAVCLALAWLNSSLGVSHYTSLFGGHTRANPFGALLLTAVLVLRIVARFTEQGNLEEHFNGPEPIGLRLKPVMTFFFGGLYFQYHLTRIAALKQAARFGQPAVLSY